MSEITGRVLMRLKEEYAEALVENMSQQQLLAYLKQIFYNDVAVAGADEVKSKIIRSFGEQVFDQMLEDAVEQTARRTTPALN